MNGPWLDRFVMVAAAFAIAEPAYAYVDPGSGSLLLQLMIAGGIGLALKFRRLVKAVIERSAGSVRKSLKR